MKIVKSLIGLLIVALFGNIAASYIGCSAFITTGIMLASGAVITLNPGILYSITPNVFTETVLYPVRKIMANMMLDSRVKQQYTPKADVLKALARITTAKLRELDASDKDYEVELEWLNACGLTPESFTSCDFGGTKGSTNVKKYKLNYDMAVKFSIDEADYINNDFGFTEALAKLLLKADKELIENYAQYFVETLNVEKGVNAYADGTGDVCGSDTYIPTANWTSNILAYFLMASQLNRFENPVLLDGGLLFQAYTNAKFNSGNDDGKGAVAAFNAMDIYFDLFNIPSVNGDILTDYLVETGMFSWANKVYFPANPSLGADSIYRFSKQTAFTEFGVPLKYDIAATADCSTNNLTKWDYVVRLKADVLTNPTGCDETNTGALTMKCGECPE